MSASQSQEASPLVDDERHSPGEGALVGEGDAEPFPGAELLAHGDGDHHARHVEEDEGHEGVGGERGEGAADGGLERRFPSLVLCCQAADAEGGDDVGTRVAEGGEEGGR